MLSFTDAKAPSNGARRCAMSFAALCAGVIALGAAQAQAAGPMNRNLGVGLSLGNPTSITVKHFNGADAIDFHLGSYRAFGSRLSDDTLFLAADYLWHVWEIYADGRVKVPFYAGPGGMLLFNLGDNVTYEHNGRRWVSRDFYLGLGGRFPVGAAAQFQKAPFEVFVELSPALLILFRERYDNTTADLDFHIANAAIGGRFYF